MMLVLNPEHVTFMGAVWEGVLAVAVDRSAAREIVQWGDFGPHAVEADVPEQRVTITVRQELTRDAIEAPSPGDRGQVSFITSFTGSEAGRRRIFAEAVVVAVTHELSRAKGAIRAVKFVAIDPFNNGASSGSSDPIQVEQSVGAGL